MTSHPWECAGDQDGSADPRTLPLITPNIECEVLGLDVHPEFWPAQANLNFLQSVIEERR